VGNPYQISSVANWQQLMGTSGDWGQGVSFVLVADVNLAGVTLTPVGNSTTPFNGVFYGNGHVVRNATINLPSNHFVGLFGFVQFGGITDLGVVGTNIQGLDYVGGLVGEMSSDGTITNCYTTGSVFGTSFYVGGLVGYNYGTISSCYSTALASGYSYVGGLVGQNYFSVNDKVTNCYATGVANGVSYIAGLVGYNAYGTIINCYATGQVIGNAPYVTGLVGVNYQGTITSCFWDMQTTGKTVGIGYGTTTGATGKSTADMKTLSTFTDAGWDFSATDGDPADWWMPANSYPLLAWPITGDIAGSYGVNFVDFAYFADRWLESDCASSNNFCGGADFDLSGTVDSADLAIFASHWLEGVTP
jgi:hypothetical protein